MPLLLRYYCTTGECPIVSGVVRILQGVTDTPPLS
nr:MAG TPA: hypothetical protein [Caudoviricetes sp.]